MNPQNYDKKLIGFGFMLILVFIGVYILTILNTALDKPKQYEFEPLAEVKETEVYQLSKDYDKSQHDKLDIVREYYFNKYTTITPTPTPEPIIEREAYRKEVTPTPTATPTPSPTPIPTATPIPTPVPMGRNQQLIWSLNAQELDMLARIARAECGGESVESMACIICMVLNRVRDPYFPNTVQGVIYSPNQFTPVRIGTFDVPATPQAWQAIELVKNGFDPSNGATYFSSGKSQWHWNSLTFVGTYGKIYMFK